MFELPLKDIHRLLDTIEDARSELSQIEARDVQVAGLPDLCMVILEVLGWTNTAYMETKLGINPSILTKFVKLRGKVPLHVARTVVDRLRTYLKSEDQAFPDPRISDVPRSRRTPQTKKRERKTVTILGERWVAIRDNNDIKMKIGAVASLLDSIIEQTVRANAPPENQILTKIEREQLIAVLDTALNVLRSPMVEKGLLKKAEGVLKRGAESAVENGVQLGLGMLMKAASTRISELVSIIFG
ncbi:MAG TPA: hypothetical protein VGG11_02565 [Xanthobacteraceae bacterium]|jgi:hypothetical protein